MSRKPRTLAESLEASSDRKRLGVYYTPPDITAYIATRTILPCLLDGVRLRCPDAFPSGGKAWQRFQTEPDRYLHQAIRQGVDVPLPKSIAAGLNAASRRKGWDHAAPEPFALPGETWREHVVRRRQCESLRCRLRAGEIQSITDLVVCNLDVQRFVRDLAEHGLRDVIRDDASELRILDPTCGDGEFLLAAADVLAPLLGPDRQHQLATQLHGVDLMPEAVEVCRMRLATKLQMETSRHDVSGQLRSTIQVGDALQLNWQTLFPAARAGFDVVIGNPPYCPVTTQIPKNRIVRRREGEAPAEPHSAGDSWLGRSLALPSAESPASWECVPVRNLYAFCMEQAVRLLAPDGWFGMIVPAGVLGLAEAASLRRVLLNRLATHFCSGYAIRPARLFPAADQRLCIYLGQAGKANEPTIFTTRYHHWHPEERETLFDRLAYHPAALHRLDRIPQLGSSEAAKVLAKLESQRDRPMAAYLTPCGSPIHYHRSPRYWIRAQDYRPHFNNGKRSHSVFHFRSLFCRDATTAKIMGAVLNSSLFFFWFVALGNGRNLTRREVAEFPMGELTADMVARLPKLFDRLMDDYRANAVLRVRRDCTFEEFRPGKSKPLLDAIDGVLAEHYGFSDEERDFIVHYDAKYRLGQVIPAPVHKGHRRRGGACPV
jgi:hypothetical protein